MGCTICTALTKSNLGVPMRPLVLHAIDVKQFGCPNCGCVRAHVITDWGEEAQVLVCVICLTNYIKLSDNLEQSRITVHTDEGSNDPEVKDHPRSGILSHDSGVCTSEGEFFYALGVEQFKVIEKCLICGRSKCIGKTLVGQVLTPEAQLKVCAMCPEARSKQTRGHRIEIDVCMKHAEHIHRFFQYLRSGGVLTKELVETAKK